MARTTVTASDLGRALAAQRQRVAHQCQVCGKGFTGLRQARYCSNACTLKASRERRKAQAVWQALDAVTG